ncbi:hypothetical protein Tco_1538071 [Tanacetum coccineum]
MSKEVGTPRYLSLVVPLKKVGDEAVHKELGDRMERAATTASSLEAEQDSGSGPRCQDTILGDVDAQTRFEITSKQSNDPPLSRGYTLGSGEDSMKLLELMELFNAAKLMLILLGSVNDVRHMLMLPVQVPAAEEGTDCLPTTTIFKEPSRMRYEKPSQKLTSYKAFFSSQWKYFIHTITQCLSAKSKAWNEFSSTMASLIICLATNQKFNMSKYIFDAMVKHLDGGVKFLMYPRFLQVFINQQLEDFLLSRGQRRIKGIKILLKKWVRIQTIQLIPIKYLLLINHLHPLNPRRNKSPRGNRGRKQKLLMMRQSMRKVYPYLPMIHTSGEYKNEGCKLEREKVQDHRLKRFKEVGTARRIKSSNDSLGAQEDASKQGRRIEDFDADDEVLDDDEMFVDTTIGEKDEQSTKIDDSTVGEAVTTASVEDSGSHTKAKDLFYFNDLKSIKKKSSKEQQQESSKEGQKLGDDQRNYKHEEVEADDTDELKKHLVIKKDDDIAIDVIPLATKPPVIVDYKLLKEGMMAHYQLIRADGSSKRYSSMIRLLQGIDREDLQTL